jgi:hypothetical protein
MCIWVGSIFTVLLFGLGTSLLKHHSCLGKCISLPIVRIGLLSVCLSIYRIVRRRVQAFVIVSRYSRCIFQSQVDDPPVQSILLPLLSQHVERFDHLFLPLPQFNFPLLDLFLPLLLSLSLFLPFARPRSGTKNIDDPAKSFGTP